MKTILGAIEIIMGTCIGVSAIISKDTNLLIVGCMMVICGKIDLHKDEA